MTDASEVVNPETTITSKVLPIKGKPREKTPPNSGETKEKKPKKADLYESIFNSWVRSPLALLPEPKLRITAWKVAEGVKQLLNIDPGEVCSVSNLEALSTGILAYTRRQLAGHESFRFTAATARECADYIVMAMDCIDKPKDVRFKTDPGLCFNRLPFDLVQGPTPTFDELFSRMTNARAVMAWIGSLFVEESYRQQYVWLYGEGMDGKSSLLEFLGRVFGAAASSQQRAPWKGDDKHWAMSYVGKRLVMFPDFRDSSSLDNGLLKSITGGDMIQVDPKFKDAYHTSLRCKLIMCANEMPSLKPQKSNIRRVIFARITTAPADEGSRYLEKLWGEGGAFLDRCMRLYKELAPLHTPIPVDEESIEQITDWAAREDTDYQLWFDHYFVKDASSKTDPNSMAEAIRFRFGDNFKSRMGAYNWLERHGLQLKQVRDGNSRVRAHVGIRRIQFNTDPNHVPHHTN